MLISFDFLAYADGNEMRYNQHLDRSVVVRVPSRLGEWKCIRGAVMDLDVSTVAGGFYCKLGDATIAVFAACKKNTESTDSAYAMISTFGSNVPGMSLSVRCETSNPGKGANI